MTKGEALEFESCMVYYGEPDQKTQSRIAGNIGLRTTDEEECDCNSVLCVRLNLDGIKIEGDKLQFPGQCWERICHGDQSDEQECRRDHISLQDDLRAAFGDFDQIMMQLDSMPLIKENAKGDLFRVSRFLHIFRRDDAYCLMHSLTQRKIFGGSILKYVYDEFIAPRSCEYVADLLSLKYPRDLINLVIEDLKEKGMISSLSDADLTDYLSFFRHGRDQYNIQNMYFIPASDCNLRCRYCFVEDEARGISPALMTEDIARRGLEIYAKLTENADRASLTFYGGEPLLNADVVYSSMRYVRELERNGVFKCPVDMLLVTNGTLVDGRTIEAVLETHTSVSVSLDGPELLNAARVDSSGKSAFKRALAGFRRLQDAGLSPGISCTLNKCNSDHIDEVVSFLSGELQIDGMGFNILIPRADGKNPLDVPHDDASRAVIRAFGHLREKGIFEDRMMRRIEPYACNGFHLKDCMGVGGQIVITPDGKIGPCQAFQGFESYFPLTVDGLYSQLYSLDSEYIYRCAVFSEWRYRFPLNMLQCIDCSAIAVCGGGCPYAAFVSKGSIWESDERVCSQSKQILEWMLWETYEKMADERRIFNDSGVR
jgi:uncharacterized protein